VSTVAPAGHPEAPTAERHRLITMLSHDGPKQPRRIDRERAHFRNRGDDQSDDKAGHVHVGHCADTDAGEVNGLAQTLERLP
jgi:hypothetical protein